ncbi:MAG: FHA domain-containing protein [Deltaproteobacteria bacterium]|nr:FHA domain-containing protein [Deltaproteobacteria bacterium]
MSRSRRHHNRGSSTSRKKNAPKGFVLNIQDGRQRGEEYHFETEATMGRTDENSIVIIDDSISRQHARVWGKKGVFLVEDRGSSNGTRLNGKILVEPEVLKDGDYITCGTVNLMFSNLDLDSAGESTLEIRLTEKQKEKLDIEIPDVSIKEKLLQMWSTPNGKIVLIAGAVVVVGFFFFIFSKLFTSGEKKTRVIPDQSNLVTEYNETYWESFLENSFGFCNGCIPHKSSFKLAFTIPVDNTRAVLTYAAGMIEKDREVEILLNGARIKYADWAPPNRPKYNYVVDLYRAAKSNSKIKLKTGQNILEFRNTYNYVDAKNAAKKETPQNESWVVFYIRIKTTALPKPNLEAANVDYKNGKEAFENRELNQANYKIALVKLYRVVDLLELAPLDKEDMAQFKSIYKDSLRTIDSLNDDLDHFFKTCRGLIQEASRYDTKERSKALLKLKEELKRFPDFDLRKKKLEEMMRDYF